MISPDRLQAALGGSWSQVETREEAGRDPGEAADNSRQHQQRQINLLDHIDAVQDEVSHRMDFIERELDGKTRAGLLTNAVSLQGKKSFSNCAYISDPPVY